jgi:hypothetical protein
MVEALVEALVEGYSGVIWWSDLVEGFGGGTWWKEMVEALVEACGVI